MNIIVLGSGIVGLTIANLLTKIANLQIILVEAQPTLMEWDDSNYDLRCSAIAPASANVFKNIGIWSDIIAQRVGIYNNMQVWYDKSDSCVDLSATEVNAEALGHIVENRVIQRALRRNLDQFSNLKIYNGCAHNLEQQADFNRVYIDDYYLDAQLVIGADGADSWLRAACNIGTDGWSYQQSSLVATIKSQLPHDRTARQRFASDGPLAFLPLAEPNLSSIVWTSDQDKIKHLMHLETTAFCQELSENFAFKLGNLELHGDRACFPLRMLHAKNYVAPRVALLGDAAHVIHPLAGQGLNLGIMDAAVLADVLQQAINDKQDIGMVAVLRKYERWRKGPNLGMIVLVETFKRSYGLLSNFNLGLVNNFSLAKKAMINFAMGTTGEIPVSARI